MKFINIYRVLPVLLVWSCAQAGYEAIVHNMTPFKIKIKAISVGTQTKDATIIKPFEKGSSKTPLANLLKGVEVEATLPDPLPNNPFNTKTHIFTNKWKLGIAKKQNFVIFTTAPSYDIRSSSLTIKEFNVYMVRTYQEAPKAEFTVKIPR